MGVSLTTTFKLIDQMSVGFDRIFNSGSAAIDQWERAGQIADTSFGRATSRVVRTSQSIDDLNSSIDEYEISTNDATASTDYLEDALNSQARAVDEAADSMNEYGNQSEDAGRQSDEFGNRSVNAVQELSKALAAAGIVVALKAIYDGFMECSEVSADFEVTTAQIATVADTTKISIGDISGAILDMSNDTGKAAMSLSDAVYQAISAGVDTSSSVEFASTATKLATGGFTEAATAVDVLTTAINAYGLRSADADNISDMLIVTQNLGKTTVDELAASVGRVIPLAAAYGVEMDNLSTAYAQLTAGGVATAEAGTYLKAMLNELGNSSSAVALTLQEETGQSFAMLMEQGYSLGDVLDVLGDSVGGDTTKFNELWSSTEAGVGALSLFNAGSEKFNSVLGQMQNSAGATAKAYGIMADITAHSEEKMTTAATNLKVVVGDQLNPTLSQLYDAGAEAFSWAGGFLEENPAVTAALTGLAIGIGVVVVAATGFALVTSPMVVSALTAINLAMGPIGWAVAGVIALTAAIVTFVAILVSQETEYDTWTASTKKQYDELQALNDEYDKACDQYGETSDEALRLRYQMDDLNAAFEANKQTVEEFVAECDALVETHDKLISSYQDSITEINQNELGTLSLIQKLGDLATATDQTVTSEEQMRVIIAQLNKELPDLALSYDEVTSSTEATVTALKKAAEAQADQNRFQKSQETYVAILEDQARIEDEIAKAEENVRLEREKILNDGFYTEDSLWASWTTDIDECSGALEKLEAAQSENATTLSEIERQWEEVAAAAEEAAKSPVAYEDAMRTVLGGIQTEMDELVAKYDEAYQAAHNSIDSTIGLFDTMKTQTELSISDMMKAMDSQVAYLETYNENLRKASEYGLDDTLISSLSDGSTESAGQLDAIISKIEDLGATTEDAASFVSDFNLSFAQVKTAKDEFAATVANMETDFTTSLDNMEQKLTESIDKMNMETEAAVAAKDTISAYIDSIKAQQASAVSAAEAVAKATSAALRSTYNGNTGKVTANFTGYAAGTSSAAEGVALVGEKGPELIDFDGGEVVYTADETEKILTQPKEPYITSVPESLGSSPAVEKSTGEVSEKKITLEIAGSGEISMDSSMNEEQIITLLYANLKPVLLGIIKQEVYEEGDRSYEY